MNGLRGEDVTCVDKEGSTLRSYEIIIDSIWSLDGLYEDSLHMSDKHETCHLCKGAQASIINARQDVPVN